MNIKNLLTSLIAIIVIFLSYHYLQPMGKGSSLEKSDYSLKTYNISKDNKWSTFRDDGKGVFFIHPGEKKPAEGTFTFKQSKNIILKFSIRKGSKVGDIEFTVKKNGKEIKKLIVTVKQKQQLIVPVQKNDKLEVSADKHGGTGQDWGNLEIKVQETAYNLKNFIIPFLWAILFIFLLGKNHKYTGINAYVGFILVLFAEKLNFGPLSFNSILIYMLFIFAMTFIFTLIYQELNILKKYKIASIVSYIAAITVYIIPLFFIIYALNYDTAVTKDILYAVFQSNTEESMEYISDFIAWEYIALFVFITAFIGFLLYRQEKKETQKIEKSLLVFLILTFLSISLAQFSSLRLPDFLIGGFEKYDYELTQFKEMKAKRKAGEINFQASKKAQGETYIFIIGESLNRKHMGIYGYLRNTTPILSKMNSEGELLIFNNAYSNHTHTVPVLSLALTEANQYNKKTYYDSLSIIDVLKKADIETYWLTNQTIYGAWDNMVSVIGTSADHLVAMNKHIGTQTRTNHLDGALINEVKKVLAKKTNKNRVIFVHLIGNHGSYASRYPHDKYSIFSGKLNQGEFGTKASKVGSINDYDNSVVYNDYVVSSILKEFQKDKSAFALMYMSDHTDDVIDKLGHNSGKFTFYMTQIPMLTWFSDKFKKEYPKKYSNLTKRKETLFSNDMLYDSMLGLFGVKTDRYHATYDFSSDEYKLEPKDALTLHGKKHYTDKSNHLYWQKVNTEYLLDTNQSSRIFPHRVDSVGKLRDIWNEGFRSFEMDVRFGDKNTTTFKVGHNPPLMGIGLEKFLNYIDTTKIQRVILNIQNLNNLNYRSVLTRLEYLNNKYHLNNKLIVESGTKDDFFKEFSNNEWHTSYYLPTVTILKLLKDNNETKMEVMATEVSKEMKNQNVSAISFEDKLYPWIKKYLEPKIDSNIIYHSWYAPALYTVYFQENLLKKELYLDQRVKTLLSTYDSQFEL